MAARVWTKDGRPGDWLVQDDEDAVRDGRQPGNLYRGEQAEHAGLVELAGPSGRMPVRGALFALGISLGVWSMIAGLVFKLLV